MSNDLHNQIRSTIRRALYGTLGIPMLALPVAMAQQATNQTAAATGERPVKMEKSVVTGSLIPTAETVGPAPVQTLSNEAITQAGSADALLTLKKLVPSFTGGGNYLGSVNNNVNIGAGFQAFTGESYVSLRNLSTLVLIDGQRVVSTALSGGQAIDLNSIPLAMIERIEVLKDGASAIYGSDAIGGVINVITKKNYNGVEINGRYGFPTDGPGTHGVQYQASVVAGMASEGTRFLAGAQFFDQNPLLSKDRHIGSQGIAELQLQNIVPPAYISPSYPGKVQAGGVSWILASSPFAVGAPGYNPNLRTPPVFPGQTFSGASAITNYNAYATDPARGPNRYIAPDGSGRGPYIPFSSTPTGMQLAAIGSGEASGWPALNTTSFGTISLLEQHRRQFWANFERELYKDKVSLYSNFLYSDNTAQGQLAPSPAPSLSISSIAVPANNPYNPFGIALGLNGAGTPRVRSRFVDFGNRTFQTFSDFYQWVGGLKGNITPDYSYDVSFDYSQDRQEQQTRNAVNGGGLNNALIPLLNGTNYVLDAQGRPLSILTGPSGANLPVYDVFGSALRAGSGVNAQETVDQLRATLFTWGQSALWDAHGVINGKLYTLPAGDLSFAAGGQFINESLKLQVDGLTQLGLVPGLNAAFAFPGGTRETAAGFIEVKIPVLSKDQDIPGFYSFEINAAGRYQTFDPGGDKSVPKVALRWQPLDEQFTLRAGYGQGFIAPSIFNLFGPDFVSNPNVTIAGANGQVTTQTRANPNLKPSNAEQFGLGIVISPKFVKNLTLGVDYYNVTEDHLPVADAQAAANSLNAFGSASPYAPGFTFDGGGTLTSTNANQVNINNWGNLIIPWAGAASLRTRGLDFSLSYSIPTENYGKITFNAVANYTLAYEVSTGTGRPSFDYVGNFTTLQGLIPDYNLTVSLAYEYSDWTLVASAHYLPSTKDPGGLFPEYNTGSQGFIINNGTQPYIIPDYYTIDLQLSYEIGKHKETKDWYDRTKLTVGCNNITNERPPLIPDGVEDNTDKNNYDILGRFVYFEVAKKF